MFRDQLHLELREYDSNLVVSGSYPAVLSRECPTLSLFLHKHLDLRVLVFVGWATGQT
jgi:hypothetical protein